MSSQPTTYSRAQITLHWLIAALVFFQIIFGESIEEYGHALRDGETVGGLTFVFGNAHIWVGVSVLILMLARLTLRFTHGVPAPVPAPKLQDLAAKGVHLLLYVLLVAAPLTGIAAWFLGIREAGAVHHFMKPAFILLIALHILGALWHQFAMKDGTMKRMMSSNA